MGIHLRAPLPGDEPAMADLAGQLGYPSSSERIAERLALLAGHEDHHVLVAADGDNRPVGWAHVFLALRVESDPFAELGGMVVATDQRGRGVGASLLNAAEAWTRSKNIPMIRVRSNVIRSRAHDFYLGQGYQQGKTAHLFEKDLGKPQADGRGEPRPIRHRHIQTQP